jgi:YggT family protein
MFALSNLLVALAKIVDIVLTIFYWLILIRALISWVSPDPFNPVVQFLYRTTEPVLEPVRRVLPLSLRRGLDISPLLVFLAIIFLKSFLVKTLIDLSYKVSGG